jgi:TPR repeat protein
VLDIERLRREAEAGSFVARTALGILYIEGHCVERDYKEAARLLSAPADHGVPRAVSNLARLYAEGWGVPQDVERAFRMHSWAASRGEFFSLVALARMYARGQGVARDPQSARETYEAVLAEEPHIQGCDEELAEARAYLASES